VELSLVTRSEIPKELERLAPDNVRVYARVSDQAREEMYATHHLFAMPSLVEGFGLVYLEALAQGLPIICSSNSGGPDIIRDGVEGFIVAAGDPEAIVERIERCLEAPELLPRMSAAAATTAQEWSWSRFRAGVIDALAVFDSQFDANI
jgi:glycosyltransferase involved in cell wall biosynthesis